MQDIGDLLRKRREELGFTLRDIHDTTRVNIRWLEAVEDGDESVFPAEVYLKGVIKLYAEAVDLDGQQLLDELRKKTRRPTERKQ